MPHANSWKAILFVMLSVLVALGGYLLSQHYTLSDLRAKVQAAASIYQYPTHVRVLVLILALGLLGGLVLEVVVCTIGAIANLSSAKKSEKRFVQYKTKERYAEEMREATRREVGKLLDSEEYRKLQADRGNDPAQWNWQTAERQLRERAYREGKPERVDASEDEEEPAH